MTDYFTNGPSIKSGNNQITDFDRVFFKRILELIPDDVCLIDTTWINDPITFQKFVDWQITTDKKRAFLYSGMDWMNTHCEPVCTAAHIFLQYRFDCTHIGNTSEGHYFSFWVEFIDFYKKYFFDECYTSKPNLQYHFMCLNNKPNDHRRYLLNKIFEQEIIYKKGNISVLQRDAGYNFEHPIILEENRPPELVSMFYDHEVLSDKHIANDIISLGDPIHWNSHFVNVVTESAAHTDVFLSEKIFKPIIGLRPFLALGDRNLYPKLREFGFDTFEDLFPNVGLDVDRDKRADNLIKDLKKVCLTPIEELDRIYSSIYNRLENNRNLMAELITKNKQWIEDLKTL